MKILFAAGTPYIPQLIGGLEINTHELLQKLMEGGHEASVLAKASYRDGFGIRREISRRLCKLSASRDHALGYTVYRARHPETAVLEVGRPDVVVVQNGNVLRLASSFSRHNLPCVSYLHGVGFESWMVNGRSATAQDLPLVGHIANSEFTATRFSRRFGVTPLVIPPIFCAERYRTDTSRSNVTFINPIRAKGVDLVFEMAARCPDIPFSFVKAWPLTIAELLRLRARMRRVPNVTLRERTSDMRTIYRDARILLMPSQVDETWGRVASEAHFSGIPVIASDRGGLPEAVGPGGLVIGRHEPVDAWVAAVNRLWRDEALYREKSAAAVAYSRRCQLDPCIQVETLTAALRKATSSVPFGRRNHASC